MHNNAAGFGINGNKVDQLIQYANTNLNPADFENCYTVDYVLNGKKDNTDLLASLASHPEYFGNHIDEIKVVITDVNLTSVMPMGANKDSMKISCNGVDYVRFKDADFVDTVLQNKNSTVSVYGRANLNNFMGRTSIQVLIDDYELINNIDKYAF